MNPKLATLLRHILLGVGAYLIGSNLFGQTIDESLLQEAIGLVLSIVSVIWSFSTKTATQEYVGKVLRHLFTFGGGIAIAAGKLDAATIDLLLRLSTILLPVIWNIFFKNQAGELPQPRDELEDIHS